MALVNQLAGKGIAFKTDRNGKLRAYFWSTRSMRWFVCSIVEARLAIETGIAEEIEYLF